MLWLPEQHMKSNHHTGLTFTFRAFNEILKTDRTTFGADDDYVIGDVVPDELQQRVDAVVARTAYEE